MFKLLLSLLLLIFVVGAYVIAKKVLRYTQRVAQCTLWNFAKSFGEIPEFSKPVCVYVCPSCNIIIPLRPNKHVCKQCGYVETLKNPYKITTDDISWSCSQCGNE